MAHICCNFSTDQNDQIVGQKPIKRTNLFVITRMENATKILTQAKKCYENGKNAEKHILICKAIDLIESLKHSLDRSYNDITELDKFCFQAINTLNKAAFEDGTQNLFLIIFQLATFAGLLTDDEAGSGSPSKKSSFRPDSGAAKIH